jgi:hypothetical protein
MARGTLLTQRILREMAFCDKTDLRKMPVPGDTYATPNRLMVRQSNE